MGLFINSQNAKVRCSYEIEKHSACGGHSGQLSRLHFNIGRLAGGRFRKCDFDEMWGTGFMKPDVWIAIVYQSLKGK